MEIVEIKYLMIETNKNEVNDICEYLITHKDIELKKEWIGGEKYIIYTNINSFDKEKYTQWLEDKYDQLWI